MSEIAQLEDVRAAKRKEARAEAVKRIKSKYPSYDAGAVRRAIPQLRSNIRTIEEQLTAERTNLQEFEAMLPLCEQRDRELAALGKE